jgi:hypothetical protein
MTRFVQKTLLRMTWAIRGFLQGVGLRIVSTSDPDKENTKPPFRRWAESDGLIPVLRVNLKCLGILFGFLVYEGEIEAEEESETLSSSLGPSGVLIGEAGQGDPGWIWVGKVLNGQYRGVLNSKITLIRDHWLDGRDTLVGNLRFHDRIGERRLGFDSLGGGFEFWSRDYGAEQWWKDPMSERIRRIANRSWKKPAFGTQMTFEDLLKIPGDFLLNYAGTESLNDRDSVVEWRVTLTPTYQSQYGALELSVNKKMGQPTKIVFFSLFGRPLKTMHIQYKAVSGAWQWKRIKIEDHESLAFSDWSLMLQGPEWEKPQADHTSHSDEAVIRRIMGRAITQPQFVPSQE